MCCSSGFLYSMAVLLCHSNKAKSIAPNTVWGVNLEQKARSKDRDEGKVSADVNVEE